MIRIGILVIDVSETRHAGIGGDGATRGARTALTPAAVRPVLTTYADIAAASYRELSHRPPSCGAPIATLIAAPTACARR